MTIPLFAALVSVVPVSGRVVSADGPAALLDFASGVVLPGRLRASVRLHDGHGLAVGEFVRVTFDAGPARLAPKGLPWPIVADSYDGARITTGTVRGVRMELTTPRCRAGLDGSIGFVFDARTREFELTGGDLAFRGVTGTHPGYAEGDAAAMDACLLLDGDV